ncbi:uncharacterized protein EAF01_000630 [Botrytis porri]|uniref:uncharacterized protein n=1 Tax=Botrytis porri TaxID=87229 RepID=UPI001900F609|nr:uncharacterized protein EAF01_000630 [Botrytis porri]KAF7914224.1 hypothetical protein EAF01_000630 [Botrytis porri]
MSYGTFLATVATIFSVLAALFVAPFAFDRMGWRFPGAPPLPLPPPPPPPPPSPRRIPFAKDSPEMMELVQLRADARVIRRLLGVIGLGTIVQAQDRTTVPLSELLDEFERLSL